MPTDSSPFSIAAAILLSLGGGAAIVAGLFRMLSDITVKRILQNEQNIILLQIEDLRKEISLATSSYDKHVHHVVEYYAAFYRHYQRCQRTSNMDISRHSDRDDLDTKKDFLDKIDAFAEDWNSRQGLVRLILPSPILAIHEQAISALNTFKDKVKTFDHGNQTSRDELKKSFVRIDDLKKQLESGLRNHLRTDKV